MLITANNPDRISWIPVSKNCDFPIQNIPFGVFITKDDIITIGTRIGDTVIDLGALQQLGYFKGIKLSDDVFLQDTLNDFIAHGRKRWREVRNRIAEIFDIKDPELQNNMSQKEIVLFDLEQVEMLLPVDIGDYTDFYSNLNHAENAGKIFFGKEQHVTPNWHHLPICYHGRSSSIIKSGTPIKRPKGQIKDSQGNILYTATNQLDFELEMGFITTDGCHIGEPININEAEEHIFGMVLLNDWSARDIQKWESAPLGPYLSKNFATTISTWIVTMDALEPFRTHGTVQDPKPLNYLQKIDDQTFDIHLIAAIKTENKIETIISKTNFKHQYWTMNQQLTHHSSNGCNIRSGDLFGSGTISAPEASGYGSMLELAWNETKPILLDDGTQRTFIQDFDTVILKGFCFNEKVKIGFGSCEGKIIPVLK